MSTPIYCFIILILSFIWFIFSVFQSFIFWSKVRFRLFICRFFLSSNSWISTFNLSSKSSDNCFIFCLYRFIIFLSLSSSWRFLSSKLFCKFAFFDSIWSRCFIVLALILSFKSCFFCIYISSLCPRISSSLSKASWDLFGNFSLMKISWSYSRWRYLLMNALILFWCSCWIWSITISSFSQASRNFFSSCFDIS